MNEKIPKEEFEKMKEKALKNLREEAGKYGSYNSYHLVKRNNTEIVRVNEYISEADGIPYDTIEYESE